MVFSTDALFSGNDDSSAFFDRERWHDVETQEELKMETEVVSLSLFTSFSTAVLLLVSVVAVGGGLGFAYYIQYVTKLVSQPIDRDYRNIPQQWIGYGEEQAVWLRDVDKPGCFTASFQGDVFVGDEEKPMLYRYSLQGDLLATLPLDGVPTAVAIGEADTLFPGQLLIAFRNRLAVYSLNGKKQTDWSPFAKNGSIHSIALTSDSIFAADSVRLVVLHFDGTGKLLKEIGRKPKEPSKEDDDINVFPGFVVFSSPISLTVSKATGMLLAANPGMHRIEAFTQDGYWESSLSWGKASSDLFGFTGCCNPVSLATFSDGRIVTAEKSSNLRVKVYFPNSQLDLVVAGPNVLTNPPANIPLPENFQSIVANSDRPLHIAAITGDRIIIYDPVLRIFRLFLPVHQNRKH